MLSVCNEFSVITWHKYEDDLKPHAGYTFVSSHVANDLTGIMSCSTKGDQQQLALTVQRRGRPRVTSPKLKLARAAIKEEPISSLEAKYTDGSSRGLK